VVCLLLCHSLSPLRTASVFFYFSFQEMSSALVLGATGCVGSAIAEALIARGFGTVYGLARSPAAEKSLLLAGVHPVSVQNVQDISSWMGTAEKCSVVIEALGDKGDKTTQKIVSEALISLRQRNADKTDVIFTSGIFSYGQDDR
jgi:nucleoside-diphosphate-sugar epimerase